MPTVHVIPMHLIDEPEIAMRVEIPDDYLRELADNIAKNGLINPITVKQVDGRYRIAAGHCRFLATQQLGHTEIQCNDYSDTDIDMEALKFSENEVRLNVSDAEGCLYVHDLYHKRKMNIEQMMKNTGRSEDWINKRLSLVDGHEHIFRALLDKTIKISHALELNRLDDRWSKYYLEQCLNLNPPIHVLKGWLAEFKLTGLANSDPVVNVVDLDAPMDIPGVEVDACWLCESSAMPWSMIFKKLHKHCADHIDKQKQNQTLGG